tara:strand:+ start:551 stop:844 length:294 start_codon:yes stop_codon:yes gene_type:complete
MSLFSHDVHKKIYSKIENALDGKKIKFEGKEWEDIEGQILEETQRIFLDEIETIYAETYRAIDDLMEDGFIDETFRDTLLEYVNNRNSKHWDSTMFY